MLQRIVQHVKTHPVLLAFAGVLTVLMIVVIRNAWLSDDIYITFRTLYNFTHGHGLRWNITERVQTYTHPLWLFSLAPLYAVTQHAWLSANLLSLSLTLLSAIWLYRIAKTPIQGVLALILLIGSKAFIDFSTSGLENPMTHFLLLLFAMEFFREPPRAPNLFKLSLLAALLMLNRMDHLLLIAPMLGWVFWQQRSWSGFLQVVLGFLPLVAWEIFSLIYYGFPFPNTYYAKVLTDMPRGVLVEQGLYYLLDSLQSDRLSLPMVALAAVLVGIRGTHKLRLLLLSGLTYLAYVVWVGGDFMTGRFMVTPFLVGVIIFTRLDLKPQVSGILTAVLFIGSLFNAYHPLYTGKDYYKDRAGNEQQLYPKGIVDEKGMAWWRSGALSLTKESDVIKVEREMKTWGPFDGNISLVKKEVAVGYRGYQNGPAVHIVDQLALTDPLLARMPAHDVPYWRIGHFFRKMPEGYLQTIETGENVMTDAQLAEYYDRLCVMTEGPIWSRERFKAILRFNLGTHDHLIDREFYRLYEGD